MEQSHQRYRFQYLTGVSAACTERLRKNVPLLMTFDASLLENRDFLLSLINNLPGMSYRCRNDIDWTMDFISKGALELTGLSHKNLGWSRKKTFQQLIYHEERNSVWKQIKSALNQKESFSVMYRITPEDDRLKWVWERGRGIYDESGELVSIEGFITDITEQKQAEEMITYLAYYDVLTGLPNRLMFLERLSRAIDDAETDGHLLALLFLDLNRFTIINKSMGQLVGDQIIKMVAIRLEKSVAKNGVVARLNSDEFIILFPVIRTREAAGELALKLTNDVFKESYYLENQEIFVTASLGVSVYPEDGKDVESLIKNADTAMKRAKEDSRPYRLYSRELDMKAAERLTLETKLRKALENNEMQVYYQPKVNLLTRKIAGLEALIRWKHPEDGMISPSEFIPLAEETGMIVTFGEWILREAMRQNKTWQRQGFPPVPIGINISARQFQDESLATIILDSLRKSGLDPAYLELEITESCLMNDPAEVIELLNTLKNIGLMISVDDFGTGYSSLSYLRRFPLDTLKIDRSFVQDMTENPDSAAIVRGIINLAHIMSLKVVAEGVESEEQLTFLREYNCNEIQGYVFSQPVSASVLTENWEDIGITTGA